MTKGPRPASHLPAEVLDGIKVVFFQECDELLAELEACLMALERGDPEPDTVNAAFRAVHSIKGSAGTFGFETLGQFAHDFEAALDHLRSGAWQAEPAVIKALLRATDALADLVRAARNGAEADESLRRAAIAELAALSGSPLESSPLPAGGEVDELDEFAFEPVKVELDLGEDEPDAADERPAWTIRFRPHPALYARANEPLILLRELQRLGGLSVELDDSALPPLPDLDPEGAYLAWTLTLRTSVDEARIHEVFEFVEGDCDLDIIAPSSPALAEEPSAPSVPAQGADPPPPQAGEELAAAPISELPTPVAGPAGSPAAQQNNIRVDLSRIDRLVDLVGELIINQAVLAQRMGECGLPRSSTAATALGELEQLTRELQDSVMAIRAQPVKSVFQRMSRLVRELETITGKQVRLVAEGEATEVDKTVIEKLTDPLTHMIRNAVDHGIEAPEARVAAGKSPEGTLKLSAAHRSGRIIIEVSDDGGGIDRERVRAKAVERGLIAADAELSESDIDNLIFAPGFSTADQVSDISGRGVGMDVVKKSVQALGGRIAVASRPGEGATVTLTLPLTLAVLDGMVVSVDGQTLVAPLAAVVETLRPKPQDVHRLGASVTLLAVRDSYLPIIDVGVALGYRREPLDPTMGVVLLAESGDGERAALLVETIQDQRQVVIKSLEANYRPVEGVAAATILGDGRVALILDVDAMVARPSTRPAWPSSLIDPPLEAVGAPS
jgi:two-component system chemotaxis sensor kinase CheA